MQGMKEGDVIVDAPSLMQLVSTSIISRSLVAQMRNNYVIMTKQRKLEMANKMRLGKLSSSATSAASWQLAVLQTRKAALLAGIYCVPVSPALRHQ